jgi:hypothetical protein
MKLSEEKTEKVFNSLSRMKLLTQIMDFEYNMEMPDLARSPLVRNHIYRIKQSISEININLSHVLKMETTTDADLVDEFSGEIMDLITVVSHMDIDSLKAFNKDLKTYLENK